MRCQTIPHTSSSVTTSNVKIERNMAYIDRDELQDYPFTGEFYKSTIDKTKPLTQQVEEEVIIASVVCDIQEDSNARVSTTARAVYDVYVPFDSDTDEVPVQRGHMFRGSQYGLLVAGKVIGVFPSQLGTFENYSERGDDVVPHRCRGYLARVEVVDV